MCLKGNIYCVLHALSYNLCYNRRSYRTVEIVIVGQMEEVNVRFKNTKKLPVDWITIEVREYFTCDAAYHEGLKLQRKKGRNINAVWLPPITKDNRERVGKVQRRIEKKLSTFTKDPLEAARKAIELSIVGAFIGNEVEPKKKKNEEYSLYKYWDIYFKDYCEKKVLNRNYTNNRNNELNKWDGVGWGLMHQPFAFKSVDEIGYADLDEYWKLLDRRGASLKPPVDMVGQKASLKTLLNKLLDKARITDKERFSTMPKLVYPPITRTLGKEEIEYLTRNEWKRLLEKVIELSGGVANQQITQEEYKALIHPDKSNSPRIDSQRNWCDLYDVLLSMWFYYLRSEDIPRLTGEWIHFDDTEEYWYFFLKILKKNRPVQHRSRPYRDGARKHMERLIKRRGRKGYLFFEQYERKVKKIWEGDDYLGEFIDFKGSQVGETLNHLLQFALKESGIEKRNNITLTNIRHTAFYLMVEENRDIFITDGDIETFAVNGFTKGDNFKSTYINKVDAETKAREARDVTKKRTPKSDSQYEMIKRAYD